MIYKGLADKGSNGAGARLAGQMADTARDIAARTTDTVRAAAKKSDTIKAAHQAELGKTVLKTNGKMNTAKQKANKVIKITLKALTEKLIQK